jgi:hypothetical protein
MKSSTKLGPTSSDLFFLGFLILNLFVVSYLGKDLYHEAIKLEKAKAQGEVYLAWADDFNKNIDAPPGPTPKSCLPKEKSEKENKWGDCIADLFGTEGAFKDFVNHINQAHPVFSKACSKADQESSGTLVFDKITPSPTGAPTYAALEDSEILGKGLNYRVAICDRGFYLIKIGEAKL